MSRGRDRRGSRVVLCGHVAAYGMMRTIATTLMEAGVPAMLPDIDWDAMLPECDSQALLKYRRAATLRQMRRIVDCRSWAVLAVNIDHYGEHNYIGADTFAQLAVAFQRGRRIYLYQGLPKAFQAELESWEAVPMLSDLSSLVAQHRSRASTPEPSLAPQLSLFPSVSLQSQLL